MARRNRTTKALVNKMFDETTMTYRVSYLHRAFFMMKDGMQHVVELYANPDHEAPEVTAERLYANKGSFRNLVSIARI